MSARQYIGARYVPKFSNVNGGVWSNSYTYEAMEIVKHGNDYYISKIPVPLGVDITNQTYWVLTGQYNGAINSLQEQINTINGEISDINDDILSVEDEIKLLQDYGDIICVSDSYGHFPSTEDNWIENLKTLIPNTVYKAEIGGASFGSGTVSFTSVITSIEGTVTDPDKVGAVIVCGGRNEFLNTAGISAGMKNFSNYVASHYPNARIYVFFVGLDKNYENEKILQTDCIPAYKLYGNLRGNNMTYVTNSEYILRNYNHLDSGGVHPNTTGKGDIARAVKNFLLSGQPLITNNIDYNQTLASSGPHSTAYADKTLRASGCGDVITIWVTSSFGLSYDTANAGNAWVEIGTLTPGLVNGLDYWRSRFPVPCRVRIDNVQTLACGWIGIQNGKVYFNLGASADVEWDRLTLQSFSGVIPTMYA